MVGITNTTAINMSSISYITNSSNPAEFFIKVNEIIFNGYLFFALLMALWIILTITANYRDIKLGREPNILHNIMYSGGAVTIASFFFRAVEVSVYGIKKGLLSDYLLWIIPIITIFTAFILWMTKQD